jgi:hypothetical protein
MQLHSLEYTVQLGNTMILDRLDVLPADKRSQDTSPLSSQALQTHRNKTPKRGPPRKIRISLPRVFASCVWEFGLQGSGAGWAMQLHPINERPRDSFVFDVVRSGRVPAVRALLESGSMSMHDQAAASEFEPCQSLLDVRSPRRVIVAY